MPCVASFTRSGVTVCLVEPGPIKTEFMDALSSLVPAEKQAHPILDNAAPWMTADVEDVRPASDSPARPPRRRLSVLRRFVWVFRFLGVIARLCPPLGDWVVRLLQRENHVSRGRV